MGKNYINAKCFIKSKTGYDEITYEEFLKRLNTVPLYTEKKFIPLHGMLMEVSQNEYSEFYKIRRHCKYLRELSIKKGEISFDMLTTSELSGEDIIFDATQNVEEQVIKQILLDKLHSVLPFLSSSEKKLIHEHYFLGISQSELAKTYGVNQSTISRRIERILSKLKDLIEF